MFVIRIYLHIIFGASASPVKIPCELLEGMYDLMRKHLSGQGHQVIAVGGTGDHVHLALNFNPAFSVEETVRMVQRISSLHLNKRLGGEKRFRWDRLYAAFTYSQSSLPSLIAYINDQETLHKNHSYEQEFLIFLRRFEVKHDPARVFPVKTVRQPKGGVRNAKRETRNAEGGTRKGEGGHDRYRTETG